MTRPARRSLIIAGAGIGGMTAALTAARAGFHVTILESAPRLEEIGAGVQLSPNATRILIELGIDRFLSIQAVKPQGLDIRRGETGELIVAAHLAEAIEAEYAAPWWVVHRADLQAALLAAIAEVPDIVMKTGVRVEDMAVHANGITVLASHGGQIIEERAAVLVGADGLWSQVRRSLGDHGHIGKGKRIAFRATVPMEQVPDRFAALRTGLWLGKKAHLVHYPLRRGTLFNLVAILADDRALDGWNNEASRAEVLAAFLPWCDDARILISIAEQWKAWPLVERPVWYGDGDGAVTLLGDAAHPMVPFIAQGAAMAIEDAAVLGLELKRTPDDPEAALRRYERVRGPRVKRVQRGARFNGEIYHLSGLAADLRDFGMRRLGGEGVLRRADWIYRWTP